MTLFHKVVFVAAALMGLVWTWLFWRIAFPSGIKRVFKCAHTWQRLESYPDGRAKARCQDCGKVAIIAGTLLPRA